MNVGPCFGDCGRIMDRGPHGLCRHCACITDGGALQIPDANHPDVSKAKAVLQHLSNDGRSYIKARDLAEPSGLTPGQARMVLRRLEADGDVEQWSSSGHRSTTYEITLEVDDGRE